MRAVWKIAYPLIISTASHTVIIFVDRLFLSHLSKEALAASLPAGFTSFVLMSVFFGTINYVNALVAQYYGAGDKAAAGRTAWQGLYLSGISYVFILVLIPFGIWLFGALGNNPAVIEQQIPYFTILMFGSLLMLCNTAFSSFFAGVGRTQLVMRANLIAMLVNLPLNALLIFGLPVNKYITFDGWGMPGAALASVVATGVGSILFARTFIRPEFRREYQTTSNYRLDRAIMKKLFRFGFPSGIRFFLNLSALNLFILMIGSIGINEQAAVNVTFSWNLVVFLPLVGISIATTTLVGQNLGAGKPEAAKHATYSALKIAFLFIWCIGLVYALIPGVLVGVFGDADDAAFAEVYPLAKLLLVLAVLYKAGDGLMLVMEGALTGAGDTRYLMKVSASLHWFLLAIPVGIMVYYLRLSLIPIWLWFMCFSMTLALTYYARFRSGKWQQISVLEKECRDVACAKADALEKIAAKHP